MNHLITQFQLVKSAYAAPYVDPMIGPSNEAIDLTPKDSNFQPLTNLTVSSIISGLISLVFIAATLIFFFMLILGGIKWMTANGDEKAIGAARSQITNALIGLAIIFAAWAILKLIETLFGINIFRLVIPTL
jgi:hypothetical protein